MYTSLMKDSPAHFRFVYFITQFQVRPFFLFLFIWWRDGGKIKGELVGERSTHYGPTTFSHIERRRREEKGGEKKKKIGRR